MYYTFLPLEVVLSKTRTLKCWNQFRERRNKTFLQAPFGKIASDAHGVTQQVAHNKI